MKNRPVAVVDVRSASLAVLIGAKDVNNTFSVFGYSSEPYLGYEKGVFLDEQSFKRQLAAVVKRAAAKANCYVGEIFVSVPAEFTLVRSEREYFDFGKPKKLSSSWEKEALLQVKAEESAYYTPIYRGISSLTLSDGSQVKTLEGRKTSSLSAEVSLVYASNYFLDIVEKTLAPNGEMGVDFIPSTLAKGLFLSRESQRKRGTLFLDFDVYDSELFVLDGETLLAAESIPLGEANLLKKFSEAYCIDDEEELEEIAKRTNLYYVETGGKRTKKIPLSGRDDVYFYDVNQMIFSLLEKISSFAKDFSERMRAAGIHFSSVAIMGEGLTKIRGLKEYFSHLMNLSMEELAPPMPYYDKSEICLSTYALLATSIDKNNKKNNSNFLFKFLKKFGG